MQNNLYSYGIAFESVRVFRLSAYDCPFSFKISLCFPHPTESHVASEGGLAKGKERNPPNCLGMFRYSFCLFPSVVFLNWIFTHSLEDF